MSIVLMGYMGSGKSLVGKYLSKKLSYDYLDLDDFIEKKENKKIVSIFEDEGEIYFRKKESLYLKEALEIYKNTVISLGGGTPCFSGNIELIHNYKDVQSIYLKTSLDVLVARLFDERAKRPMIAHLDTKESLKDFIRKHVFERSFYYLKASHNVLTDEKTADQICEECICLLF